jgi:hypothetical protein
MSKKVSISVTKKTTAKKVVTKIPAVPTKKQLMIMVSSTVYDSESDLDQISAILGQQFGYNVIMSKEGSVYVSMKHVGDTKAACLQAVNDCDLFFGIIFPRYGSGITHAEFLEAKRLDKPMWFIAHEKIEFLRKLLHPKMYTKSGKRKKFEIPKTTVLDSVKVVDMYNDVRKYWVQSFKSMEEVKKFIETQFGDMKKRIRELEELKQPKK